MAQQDTRGQEEDAGREKHRDEIRRSAQIIYLAS